MSPDWNTHSVEKLIEDKILSIGDGYRAKNIELAPTGIPFARVGNIDGGFHFSEADLFPLDSLHKVGEKIGRPGDVVLTSKGTVGRFAFVRSGTPQFVYSPQLSYWRSLDLNTIDSRFLFYWIQGEEFIEQANGVKSQTDMADYVSLTDQRRMKITLPPVENQRAIARILGALDDKIELNRRMNHTLEEMARALFKSWFMDFDPVIAKAEGRIPFGMNAKTASLFPAEFEGSELGAIPKSWKVETLGNVLNITKGRSYSSSELQDSETALVSLKSFKRGGGYRRDGLKSYIGKYNPEQVLLPGDLVVSCTDITQEADVVGRPAIIPNQNQFKILVASLDLLILRPLNADITTPFLNGILSTDDYVNHIIGHASGTTVLHLSRDGVPSYKFVMPPSPILKAFNKFAKPIYEKLSTVDNESENLASIRNALLPRLMSGELRVKG